VQTAGAEVGGVDVACQFVQLTSSTDSIATATVFAPIDDDNDSQYLLRLSVFVLEVLCSNGSRGESISGSPILVST
jgi:hypothetical protein